MVYIASRLLGFAPRSDWCNSEKQASLIGLRRRLQGDAPTRWQSRLTLQRHALGGLDGEVVVPVCLMVRSLVRNKDSTCGWMAALRRAY